MLSLSPIDVLDAIWDLVGSVSEGFLTHSSKLYMKNNIKKGRSVVFPALYANFCLCPRSVIITTLNRSALLTPSLLIPHNQFM